MTVNIKVKEIVPGCLPESIDVGDWVDLRTARDVDANEVKGIIPLGIAMELPRGYEAHVLPRSSTFKRWGIIMTNSMGIIDNSYCGDGDEWGFPFYRLDFSTGAIPKGTRIAQFRIVKNQPPIKLVEVDTLGNDNRGGFGSTGER